MNLDALKGGLRPLDTAALTGASPAAPPPDLTTAHLSLLSAVQDRLIPPEGDLPGAGQSGAAARANAYLAERPDWRAEVLAALEAVETAAARVAELRPPNGAERGFLDLTGDERDAALQGLEAAEPRLFARLLRITYTAYYTDPEIRRLAGFEALPPQPGGYGLEPFDTSRLENVRRRGRLWREA